MFKNTEYDEPNGFDESFNILRILGNKIRNTNIAFCSKLTDLPFPLDGQKRDYPVSRTQSSIVTCNRCDFPTLISKFELLFFR